MGERLAIAAMGVAYGAEGAYAGPTLAGCTVASDTITLRFNSSLLRGGAVGVKHYDGISSFSAMRVLVEPRYWCNHTTLTPVIDGSAPTAMCADPDSPNWGQCGTDVQCFVDSSPELELQPKASLPVVDKAHMGASPKSVWVLVDVKQKSDTEVSVDLSALKGATPQALRYAWDNEHDSCCQSTGPTKWCEPAACPIWGTKSGLPGTYWDAL